MRAARFIAVAALALAGAACGDDDETDTEWEQRGRCVDAGNVALLADEDDNWADTVLIACLTPEQYQAVVRARTLAQPRGETP